MDRRDQNVKLDYTFLEGDSDEELSPPALSTYALSLLEEGKEKVRESFRGPLTVTTNSAGHSTTQSPTSKVVSHSIGRSGRVRHSRLKAKLDLGAPRRVSDNSSREYSTYGISAHATPSYTSLTKLSSVNTDTKASSVKARKRSLVVTPKHVKTGYSPVVKRSDSSSTPYNRDGILDIEELSVTPVKVGHGASMDEMYDTPEQVRRALTPLSENRQNLIDVWGSPKMLNKDHKSVNWKDDKGYGSSPAHFKQVLEQELRKQREQILKEVREQHEKEDQQRETYLLQRSEKEHKKWLDEIRTRDSVSSTVPQVSQTASSDVICVKTQAFKLEQEIGKGGSSKVYRAKRITKGSHGVMDYAIKVVKFDQHDQATISEFKGEVKMLKKLKDEERVVELKDFELKPTSLVMVMECGEIDLAQILQARASKPFDLEFVRYHTREVFKCVKAVHEAGVVHSDLKPANFLFVRGTLKLIDFGISNSLSDETVNIYRDCQMGTPNYMAPETLTVSNTSADHSSGDSGVWKVGKPADIWSCGCIIYQMCYGKPPYSGYPGHKKILAITNPKIDITYPRMSSNGGPLIDRLVLDTMQRCLKRDPAQRATATELLSMPFLNPKVVTQTFMGDLVRNAVQFGLNNPGISDRKVEKLVENIWNKVDEYC
ncbi:hypothetical protein FOA43_004605 [Brettanomyces nanus]|uniref:Protein kinase domain-containing protein n=1 Tax=Eeniella nana TaxID=13502 RepID=A0A875S8F5_EENNA|nr:uncharacterized protein FOA43_004605 [Brettanomyces nanus]QPG77198.1 hypothetical protein FOA43_004605 [Brettanomyces nanus]